MRVKGLGMDDECTMLSIASGERALCPLFGPTTKSYPVWSKLRDRDVTLISDGWDSLEELERGMVAGVNEVHWDPLTANRSRGAHGWASSYQGLEHTVPAVMLLLAMDNQGRFGLMQFIASSILKPVCSRCKLIQPNSMAWILLGAQLHKHNYPFQPQNLCVKPTRTILSSSEDLSHRE